MLFKLISVGSKSCLEELYSLLNIPDEEPISELDLDAHPAQFRVAYNLTCAQCGCKEHWVDAQHVRWNTIAEENANYSHNTNYCAKNWKLSIPEVKTGKGA